MVQRNDEIHHGIALKQKEDKLVESEKISDKEKAQKALNQRPETFRWTINGTTYAKSELIKKLGTEPESGTTITDLAKNLKDLEGGEVTNTLGKRYSCLVCGTGVLATKAGNGKICCCEQFMEVLEPKPIPSSD